jgi:hypothetical protein
MYFLMNWEALAAWQASVLKGKDSASIAMAGVSMMFSQARVLTVSRIGSLQQISPNASIISSVAGRNLPIFKNYLANF